MNRDQLFLLNPGFMDKDSGPYFCPGCAEMVGLLEFYPELKDHLTIHYVNYPRPRPELITLLGEENQSCPVLVLETSAKDLPAHIKIQHANGHTFVEGPREIAEYLAHAYRIGHPH